MTATIRERKNKNSVTYQVIIDRGTGTDGKRKRDFYTCKSKKEAKALCAEKTHEYNTNNYIEPSKMTVRELCDQWFKVYVEPQLAPNTRNGYRVNLEKHIYPYIGDVPVQKLTTVQVQDCYTKLSKKGLKPRSIHYVHTTLHSALKYAYKLQIISKNVTELVSLPKEEKFKPDIYTEAETAVLLDKVKGTEHEIPVYLAVGLGLRRGEVFGLKWGDIDFANNTIHVCHNLTCTDGKKTIGKPKTESGERDILVPDNLIAILKAHRADQASERLRMGKNYKNNDLVCCSKNGDMLNTGTYSKRFGKFLEKNNLRHIRFHDLRHMNATLMLAHGVSMKVASERLGHADITTTMNTYSHVTTGMQKDAAEQLNLVLLKANGA